MKFQQRGQRIDLDEVIFLHRKALEYQFPPRPDRFGSLSNLANALSTRFKQGGHRIDLDEAISLHRQALELRLPSHSDRFGSLNSLANALLTRFHQDGGQVDLDEAIFMNRHALELLLPSHPDRSTSLCNLASALSTRFKQRGQKIDIDEAISLHRQAFELRLSSDPDRFVSPNSLSNALLARFEQGGGKSDLDEAIALNRHALELQTQLHPDRSTSLCNLASALSTKFQLEGQIIDLEEAMSSFRAATQCLSQYPSHRLRVAKAWIRQADRHQHISAIYAYEAALEVLRQVAALGFNVRSQQVSLAADNGVLFRDASICAIRTGNLEKSIEFFEEGESIFWSQVLNLRSSFDQLCCVTPVLATNLQRVATMLESGFHRDSSVQDIFDNAKLSIDQESSRLNYLNEEWVKCIDEVRMLPGFEDFLRPSPLSSLKYAASKHPVIILVANDDGGHCLLMTSTSIHHLPLPKLHTPMLQRLVHLVQVAVSNSSISRLSIEKTREKVIELLGREREMRVKELTSSNDIFRFVLRVLWDELVKPIIDFLNIKVTQ